MITAESLAIVQATVGVVREYGADITRKFYSTLFAAHPELTNLFNMSNQASGEQQQALASAVYAYAANIQNPTALEPILSRIAHKHASLGIKPAQYTLVGKHLLAAIKSVLGEAATPEILAAWDEAYWLLACELVAREASLYTQQQVRLDESFWQNLQIEHIIQETPDIKSLYLIPASGESLPSFVAGQYVSVALETDTYRQIRQYSLSDTSAKPYWRITVKRETSAPAHPAGLVSNWLHTLAVGDKVKVGKPYGDFVLSPQAEGVVLMSAGVGITPMVSILNSLVEQGSRLPIRFIHAAREPSHIALYDEVQRAYEYLTDYKTVFFYENAKGTLANNEFIGFMDLQKAGLDLSRQNTYYLCGPLAFIRAQRQWLQAHGIPTERIQYEVFGPDMFAGLQ
ncbi:globin domain-containing protein [Thiofilum flexile]|uniref:globin domain-containing protein n=1 Tax=Thiofilum flexile TaxID=125627 RepID=UPI00037A7EB7|nr:globin domain-containing protein [Thiofilum flexile]